MKMIHKLFQSLLFVTLMCSTVNLFAQRQMENLNRGVVAINQGGGKAFVSWRLLGTEPTDLGFYVYRVSGTEKAVLLNSSPITGATNLIDEAVDFTKDNTWFVTTKKKSMEAKDSYTLKANSPIQNYISIPVRTPDGYSPNDVSTGDLDGDGEYELVVHMTGRAIDNPSNGISGIPILQAYQLDGTFMWEINLGVNIREGAHYTQFMVADLDGDGKAEVACKTGDGTKDALGNVIGDASKDWRNENGKILTGPEYFTVFSGETGKALATVDYIPERGPLDGWGGWGGNGGNDSNGNRIDRFLACVAYLDGNLPSVVMCRGYYGRSVLAAWDYREGKLTSRWVFDSKDRDNPYSGQGYHSISVADVDNDGCDEIIYGSMVVDNDGKGLFTTGFRHGDALHVSDLDPSRPGLEVFGVHENEAEGMNGAVGPGAALFNARSGEVYWRLNEGVDVGRGVAEDIYDANPGAEYWYSGSGGLLNSKGEKIAESPRSTNFVIWWDGGLTRQLLDGNRIEKYNEGVIFTAENCQSNNGSKSTPALSADILGDWREELILRTSDNKELRIFVTTIPTEYRMYTLMHDPVYRNAIAWQNVGYNQPPHLGFWLGAGVEKAPKPNIVLVGAKAQKGKK